MGKHRRIIMFRPESADKQPAVLGYRSRQGSREGPRLGQWPGSPRAPVALGHLGPSMARSSGVATPAAPRIVGITSICAEKPLVVTPCEQGPSRRPPHGVRRVAVGHAHPASGQPVDVRGVVDLLVRIRTHLAVAQIVSHDQDDIGFGSASRRFLLLYPDVPVVEVALLLLQPDPLVGLTADLP